MPMYEYECRQCGAKFELRRNLGDDDADVRCPDCGSEEVKRSVSAFSCGSGIGDAGGGCAPAPSG